MIPKPTAGEGSTMECAKCHRTSVVVDLEEDCPFCDPDPSPEKELCFHNTHPDGTCDVSDYSPEKRIKGSKDSVCNDCFDEGFKGAPCPHIDVHEKNECPHGIVNGADECPICAPIPEAIDILSPDKPLAHCASCNKELEGIPASYAELNDWVKCIDCYNKEKQDNKTEFEKALDSLDFAGMALAWHDNDMQWHEKEWREFIEKIQAAAREQGMTDEAVGCFRHCEKARADGRAEMLQEVLAVVDSTYASDTRSLKMKHEIRAVLATLTQEKP